MFRERRTFQNVHRNHRQRALECKETLRNLMKNLSKIDQKTSFLRAPNPIAFLTRFWEHFGTILGPFWEVLVSICLHFGCPGLSGGLLGRLGASWGASGPPNLNFDRFWTSLERSWSHFGAILDARDNNLDVQTSILEPQVNHLGGSDMILPHQASKPFQASRPPSLQASSGLGGIREA